MIHMVLYLEYKTATSIDVGNVRKLAFEVLQPNMITGRIVSSSIILTLNHFNTSRLSQPSSGSNDRVGCADPSEPKIIRVGRRWSLSIRGSSASPSCLVVSWQQHWISHSPNFSLSRVFRRIAQMHTIRHSQAAPHWTLTMARTAPIYVSSSSTG